MILTLFSENPHNDDTSMVHYKSKLNFEQIEKKRNEIMTSKKFEKLRKYWSVQLKRINHRSCFLGAVMHWHG